MLKNIGKYTHTFTIDELGINVRLAPGETKTVDVEIKPDKVGVFTLYCIPHRGIGMVGNITITAPAPRYS